MVMTRYLFILLFLGTFSLNAQATTVNISPADCLISNCETGGHQFNDRVVFTQLASLDLLYKDGPGEGEEGLLKDSYSTIFNGDNSGATISFDGGLFADCNQDCYLVVKDGNHDPGRYLFNLALNPFTWDGQMDLALSGFWPGGGEISHVAIFGSAVPIPAAAWLFGTALIGFVGMSRRRTVG
jgi:hypothetical protein